jgi:hypothetical protein
MLGSIVAGVEHCAVAGRNARMLRLCVVGPQYLFYGTSRITQA